MTGSENCGIEGYSNHDDVAQVEIDPDTYEIAERCAKIVGETVEDFVAQAALTMFRDLKAQYGGEAK